MADDQNRSSYINQLKGDLLLVDDDRMMLKLMNSILSKVYNVRTAGDGIEALEILKSGFKPGVIISDQVMPLMNGSEFLQKSISIVPNAARIVVTATTDAKEIVKSINQSRALMYINKPFDKLDLIQAALIGFDHNKNKELAFKRKEVTQDQINILAKKLDEAQALQSQMSEKILEIENIKTQVDDKLEQANQLNQNLLEENKILKQELKKLTEKAENSIQLLASLEIFPNQAIQSLTDLIKDNEKHYFKNHTDAVVEIVRDLAVEFQLEPNKIKTLLMAAVLHNAVVLGMPDRLKFTDPMNMDDILRAQYMRHFNRTVQRLSEIDLLTEQAKIISQIWEHKDGSGYPRGISGDEISFESQLIAIANIYHNFVYRLTPEQLTILKQKGNVEQPYNETNSKHKDIMTLLYKWSKWFDYDVLRVFQEKTKHKEIRLTNPKNETLSIAFKNNETDFNDSGISLEISFASEMENFIEMFHEKVVETYEQREVHPYKIKPGMITINRISTINGIEVVGENEVLNPTHLKKIKQLYVSEMIKDKFLLKVPIYK